MGRVPNPKVDFADNDGGGAASGLLSRDLSPSTAASESIFVNIPRVQDPGQATQFTMSYGKLIPDCSDDIANCGQSNDKMCTKLIRRMQGKNAYVLSLSVSDKKWLEPTALGTQMSGKGVKGRPEKKN